MSFCESLQKQDIRGCAGCCIATILAPFLAAWIVWAIGWALFYLNGVMRWL